MHNNMFMAKKKKIKIELHMDINNKMAARTFYYSCRNSYCSKTEPISSGVMFGIDCSGDIIVKGIGAGIT